MWPWTSYSTLCGSVFLLIKWYGGTYHIRLMVRIRSVNACNSLRTVESLKLSGGEGERGSGEPSVSKSEELLWCPDCACNDDCYPLPIQPGTAIEKTHIELLLILTFSDSLGADTKNWGLVGEPWFETQTSIIRPEHLALFPLCLGWRHMEVVCSSWVSGLGFASGRWKTFTCYLP